MLEVRDLRVSVEEKEILKGLSLSLGEGEVVAIMGPNGSGKSTLANALMGHPGYTVTAGEILLKGSSILEAAPEERARQGLFLSFQYPSEIPGVTLFTFLRAAINAQREARGEERMRLFAYTKLLEERMALLGMRPEFKERDLNAGFSGGEKKRAEILQLAMLDPDLAILDETDSGLDIDALKAVADGIGAVRAGKGILLITHYQRILEYVTPDRILIMKEGRIVKEGGPELAQQLEQEGYAGF